MDDVTRATAGLAVTTRGLDADLEMTAADALALPCIIHVLPPELLLLILAWCNPVDAGAFGRTCRTVYRCISSDTRRRAWLTRAINPKYHTRVISSLRLRYADDVYDDNIIDMAAIQLPEINDSPSWRIVFLLSCSVLTFFNVTRTAREWAITQACASYSLCDAYDATKDPIPLTPKTSHTMHLSNSGNTLVICIRTKTGGIWNLILDRCDHEFRLTDWNSKDTEVAEPTTRAYFDTSDYAQERCTKEFSDGVVGCLGRGFRQNYMEFSCMGARPKQCPEDDVVAFTRHGSYILYVANYVDLAVYKINSY